MAGDALLAAADGAAAAAAAAARPASLQILPVKRLLSLRVPS
jgi:hypothetical protein